MSVAELVGPVIVRQAKIRRRVPVPAALQPDDPKPQVGQFLRKDAASPPHADDDDIHRRQARSHFIASSMKTPRAYGAPRPHPHPRCWQGPPCTLCSRTAR